jgi:hypothetical protein
MNLLLLLLLNTTGCPSIKMSVPEFLGEGI